MEEKKTIVSAFATDGFRYITFEPPVDVMKLGGLERPSTDIFRDLTHFWEPTSVDYKNGLLAVMGYQSEAFVGSNQTFDDYIQTVSAHIGGVVKLA